ncbi:MULTISPECIES: four helix bundle protein [Chryseobacterium]|uniref:Four helix bundle protein n=1 Tax=Chryseobacterium camelliae TaxID=1265445 RepID=A0ABU0TNB6_9FLAO|nr:MULTISPECIES: four helix bundle protein [Chryseobacterium]MDT3407864.1 four helix bundle protein [Pseudacidovorax intermedius]MDQ1098281.1 four helix bundle protein [Chryseobacterium camelliae]MDQ1102206.1 four helix bundle protein [Chryseobacterium sp. SORGH_AS_1048]MDR6085644.1 four helix bundle protein [Chryseobacterium sp. SORGH_AS_0909]MDR6130010.1 four helix bundle protein [Chryseobacterium sp. SORGH_AS_1175]
MENNYNQIFAKRTKALAIKIINDLSELPYSDKVSVIRKQIFRSASSVAANYRAMCRARSDKEKYAKICIVVEEADETVFWLEVIEEISLVSKDKISELMRESLEILKVTSTYKSKLSNK